MTKNGKVVLVGAGPGDLDLLTLKGKEYIEKADCIVYDRLLNKRMLSLAKEGCEMIFVGKENHHHTVPQDKINELLYEKAKEYGLVVRLKGGDPYVFGRGGEEALFLLEKDVDVEVVPGISSSIAALAAAGIPITHRGLAKGFQVITAHSRKDALADIDYKKLSDETVTLVFLMGLSHVGEIARGLVDAGRSSDTPVAVVSNGTTNRQRKVIGTLADIEEQVLAANIESPAIIVVGQVVTLAGSLAFFENRPLFGKKYFLPKIVGFNYSLGRGVYEEPFNELEIMLGNKGAEVFAPASGKIIPKEIDLSFLESASENDYLVFTSANGVKSFFWNLFEKKNKDIRYIGNIKFAAVGKKTAEVLKGFGVKADIIPKKQQGIYLASSINEAAKIGANIYWICGREHNGEFEKTLSSFLQLTKIVSYENEPVELVLSDEEKEWVANCDGVILTSGSNALAVRDFVNDFPTKVFSIGPTSTESIVSSGIKNVLEAVDNSYKGIMDIILA